jgi:hypothetical protein
LVNLGLVWEDYIDIENSPAKLKALPGISVSNVIHMIRRGDTVSKVRESMPGLTLEMVLACLAYASHGGC